MARLFRDRADAGQRLATKLAAYARCPDVLVLALPRGGVPVAAAVAQALDALLDVYVVRKLVVPGREELAIGAIASGGVCVLNDDVVAAWHIPPAAIDAVAADERRELARREHLFRGDRPAPDVHGRTVILVDDGLATGATMRAAIAALRRQQPARIVAAVPVAAPSTCDELKASVDEVVCAVTPAAFYAVGQWYEDFAPPSHDEIRALLGAATPAQPAASRCQ